MPQSFESVSTWRQELPSFTSETRRELVAELAHLIVNLSGGRLRIAVDGYTAAGKTTFGHELAAACRVLGRSTARASLDDFKHLWSHAREHGYDRTTGHGYYRNAYDCASARELLLEPAGEGGDGRVALCAFDPLTGEDHRRRVVQLPTDTILVVDSVFAFRPEYDRFWDFRIWLDVSPELAMKRGIERDTEMEGATAAAVLHRDRYHAAELLYIAEVNPRSAANAVVENSQYSSPQLLRLQNPVTRSATDAV